jgi:hypothetical protein
VIECPITSSCEPGTTPVSSQVFSMSSRKVRASKHLADNFLLRHGRRSHKRGGATHFPAVDDGDCQTMLGFYSLAPASLQYAKAPAVAGRGQARYKELGFRLARLAVDLRL